jgi:hypothetical protein
MFYLQMLGAHSSTMQGNEHRRPYYQWILTPIKQQNILPTKQHMLITRYQASHLDGISFCSSCF